MGWLSTATIKHFWIWTRKSSNIPIFSIHRPSADPLSKWGEWIYYHSGGERKDEMKKGEMGSLSLVRAKLLHSAFQGQLGFWERFLLNVGPGGRALMLINLPQIHWFNLDRNTMWVCSSPYSPTTIAIPLSRVSWESLFACFPKSVFILSFFSFVLFAQRCDQSLPLWGFHLPGETSQNQHCLAWYLYNVHVNFQ